MRIINFLKSNITKLINNYNSFDEPIDEEISNSIFNLQFSLNQDLELELYLDWEYDEEKQEFTDKIAETLKILTTGGYDNLIMSIMIESSLTNPNTNPELVQYLISKWQELEIPNNKEKMQNFPVINPLRTFGESNFGNQGQIL